MSDEGEGEWKQFRLTYYDDSEATPTNSHPSDPYYGITASGRPSQEGLTIATDPNVIPLGTWVLLKWPDGRIEKRRADDTGGAIKGMKIDYYVPKVTSDMGVEQVQIKVLGKA